MPSFIFKITEVREHVNVRETMDAYGYWTPSLVPGHIQSVAGGISDMWWMCNGHQMRSVGEANLPMGTLPWKTYSVFYIGGYGFRVLHGYANNPANDQIYHPLGFEHDVNDDRSSYLTHVMRARTLCCQKPTSLWPRMLLPNIYHGPPATMQRHGGLKGELPIFLALLAFSMPPDQLPFSLVHMLQAGVWQQYHMANGWIDKRGVTVTVYTFSTQAGGSTAEDLAHYEGGHGQGYYA